jgi:hyperosmotically inducible protein
VALLLYGMPIGLPLASAGDETLAETARARTFVKDSPVGQKVRVRLDSAGKDVFDRLHVDADAQGVVWLRGAVRVQEDAQRAVDIARATDGVKSVNSRIRIEP